MQRNDPPRWTRFITPGSSGSLGEAGPCGFLATPPEISTVSPPLKARDFEDWLERGGARHLGRQRVEDLGSALDLPEAAVDDIMKWANG